ncbi:MAG TPA: protein-glutamate O-methyltransferase CheR [Gemmatimonadales bacterium]
MSALRNRESFETAAAFVRRRTGLVFGASRRSGFEAALEAHARRSAAGDIDAYLARLSAEPALLDDLVADITVGETHFFRDAKQFDLIRNTVIPDLLARRGADRPLRIWSAGCAAGEEAYTVTIVVHELGLGDAARIVATDLSRTALARARRARYGRWSLRGVTPATEAQYFKHHGDEFRFARELRDAVEFRYLNLAEDTYPSLASGIWGMDLILCRNVLIYFDAETVGRVLNRLVRSLAPDGWLLLGASDPLATEFVPVDAVITTAGLAYRKRGRGGASGEQAAGADPVVLHTPPASATPTWWTSPPPAASAEGSTWEPSTVPPAGNDATAPALATAPAADDVGTTYAAGEYARAAELAGARVLTGAAAAAEWVILVRALANCGALARAGAACAAGLERHPLSAELLYMHGVLIGESGRPGDAVAALRRALYADGRFAVAHLALGGQLLRAGDGDGARRAFRNAARLLDESPADAVAQGSDGERAGRLASLARAQLALLQEAAP